MKPDAFKLGVNRCIHCVYSPPHQVHRHLRRGRGVARLFRRDASQRDASL
jgi:hypothetical protein